MTDPTNGQTRTRAWKRLRKLLGIDPGTERRAILQAAADKIEWLRKKGQELKNLVEMIAGQRDAALAERDALKAEVERLREVVRRTHANYCVSDYTDRGRHASECLLFEIEDTKP